MKNCITALYHTPAGILQIDTVGDTITHASFVEALASGVIIHSLSKAMSSELAFNGTEFQKIVWQTVLTIPAGSTITYQELAHKIGKPRAHRAVANALAANKIAYLIPCHRVIQKSGKLGGYAWGIARKQALLQAEKS